MTPTTIEARPEPVTVRPMEIDQGPRPGFRLRRCRCCGAIVLVQRQIDVRRPVYCTTAGCRPARG